MIIGLTGGIGSGKSTVANIFSKFNDIAIYNADIEAKRLMSHSDEIKSKLINEFGEDAYKHDELNRPYIANIVFNNKEKLTLLNSIVHPVVHEHLQSFIKRNHKNQKHILYENAILFENNSHLLCDKIITVTAPLELRIQRVIKRDNATYEEVKKRVENQWKDSKKLIQSHYVVHNINLKDTKNKILKVHNFLTNKIG